jgi:2'-5' RNA ligase
MTRLFVAVWPPEHVLEHLADIAQPRDQGVRWVPNEQRHITLRFLGDADIDEVGAALARAEFHGATARLGPAYDFLGDRALVVPVAGLDRLADDVRRATRDLGSASSERRFVGHLTVAKLRRGARPSRAAGQRFEATFDVEAVALVASTLRPDGPEYETIDNWPAR